MSLITPEVNHHFSSGVYAKEAFIPAGKWLVQHAHKFDHLSVLAQGSVELSVDGVVSVIHAPTCLTIAAGKHHGVKSLTDVVWYCIHATDCTDIDKIDEILITATDPAAVNLIANTLGREN
jgi:mannose-6-phosphate isomerase-like protein (cupin superfamily)